MRLRHLVPAAALLFIVALGCESGPTGPDGSTPSGMSATSSTAPAPATFYEACLANGSLDGFSSIGTSAASSVACKGKGTAVVLRTGSGVGFCFQPGKSASDFTIDGVPSCRGNATVGTLAAGTDYSGCVDRGRLTEVSAGVHTCSKGTAVGFSTPRRFDLTVVKAGDGSGSVTSNTGGIDCPSSCAASFVENTSVTLTRSVGSGSVFSGWSETSCTGATCTVLLTSSVTVTATFAVQNCTPSLAIDGPAIGGDTFTRVYRKDPFDFTANLQLAGTTCGSWTTAWTYKFGDAPAAPVPTAWISGAVVTVPKWTLEKYAATGKRYTFTLTATPPSGSGLSPLTATRIVQVLGTRPQAGFAPTGFTAPLVPDVYTYRAHGQAPASVDYDNPPDSPKLWYHWYAEVFGGDEIAPLNGQGTPLAQYRWTTLETFLIRLTVCPGDEPDLEVMTPSEIAAWPHGFTGCSTTNDFIFSTTAAGFVRPTPADGSTQTVLPAGTPPPPRR